MEGQHPLDQMNEYKIDMQVDPVNNRYPYCIVWTALPCLTCCVPCIGHTGICKSNGFIYDFVGMGPMHSGQLAFGSPLKYYQLQHESYTSQQWDNALQQANNKYSKTNHNLITNNCHHHVADVLNNLKYKNRNNWGQVDIAMMMVMKGKHVGYFSYWVYILLVVVIVFFLVKF